MFTGVVERTGRVRAIEDRPGRRVIAVEMRVDPPFPPWSPTEIGESISVSGVCLTAIGAERVAGGETVSFDAVPETLGRTTLQALRVGHTVNIERSLRAGDRFGGHYVTGHVDGVGTVRSRRPEGDQVVFEIAVPPALTGQMIPKGSVAVDGISLTVIDVSPGPGTFTFAVIPHTLGWTTLGERLPGHAVNIETDAFGKWVLHALRTGSARPAGADESRLHSLLEQLGGASEAGGPGGGEPGGGTWKFR